MRKEILKFFFSIILLFAFSYCSGPGTSSASFLKIGIGAKSAGMSDAFSAVADDPSTIYWNPAGVAKLSEKEIAVMHNEWLANIKHNFLGYIHPLNKFSLGLGCIFLSMDPIPLTEDSWITTKSFTTYSYAIMLNFSRREKYFLWGANLKFVQEKIYRYVSSAYGVDIGTIYQLKNIGLDLGLSVLNIGTQMKFLSESDRLPLEVRLGTAYHLKKEILVAFDISQPVDNNTILQLGLHCLPFSFLSLCAGYKYKLGGNDIEGFGFSAGVGIRWKWVVFDYAFVPFGVLGQTHKIFLSFKLGKK